MISEVIKFENGMVLVFDEKGKQMVEYQGRYQDVRVKILAWAPKGAKFYHKVTICGYPQFNIKGKVARKEW